MLSTIRNFNLRTLLFSRQVLYVDASPQQFRVCNSFCQTLYRACSNVMIQGQNRTVQDLYSTPDLFCQQFAPLQYQVITKQNSDLCFPGLDTPTSAAQSYAFGSGLYQGLAGFDTVWYIQAVDVFQNKKLVGGDPFLVQEFPNINSLDFIDNKDGTYTVSYIPDALTYNFSVTLLSEFIKNSPFSVTYLNSTTCPLTRGGELPYHPTNPIIATSNCSRYQNTACCSAQDLANLQLWIEDNSIQEIYGTSPLCLHYWDLFLCGAPCAPYQSEFITFDQIGNTTELTYELCPEFCSAWYSACYNVTTVGGLTVGYLFNSTQFCESHTLLNISVNIRNTSCFSGTDRNTSAPNSCPYGEGLVGFHEAGSNNSFIIQAADIYGNNRTTGGDNFTVILEGPNNITIVANVTDNMDGTYLVVYNATIAGNYEIIVTLNGEPVCNSPFFVSILPGKVFKSVFFF